MEKTIEDIKTAVQDKSAPQPLRGLIDTENGMRHAIYEILKQLQDIDTRLKAIEKI